MSYKAIKWSYTARAVLDNDLSPFELAVLRALCWYYREEGATHSTQNCFPGVAKLAKDTGLNPRTVNLAKKRLRELNLISWDRAANLPGAAMRTNSYRINCPSLEKTLKRNEARLQFQSEYDPDYIPPMKPGVNYVRPDPETLLSNFSGNDAAARAEWLADALEFVFDGPGHRRTLLSLLSRTDDLAHYRDALARVFSTSAQGRRITNRMGYLVRALKTGVPGQTRG